MRYNRIAPELVLFVNKKFMGTLLSVDEVDIAFQDFAEKHRMDIPVVIRLEVKKTLIDNNIMMEGIAQSEFDLNKEIKTHEQIGSQAVGCLSINEYLVDDQRQIRKVT